ncbi:MAG TPA: hypothetical protein VN693_08610 [Rhodanobacteraceae bacterium]|nr:hypothetical protein [Rhodanobacteraceae bacterium]
MDEQILPFTNISHPAPHRHRVSLGALVFGIAGAPLAWNVELLAGAALAGHQCYPRDIPLSLPRWTGTWEFLLTLSLAAIVLGLSAGGVAWHSWGRVRDEMSGSGGEGRTRFLALSGMLCSGLFLLALLFTLAVVWLVPLCST